MKVRNIVNVVTRLQVGLCRIHILAGARYFLLPNIHTGRSLSIFVLNWYQGSFSLVKWPECEPTTQLHLV
jgi:hypothetical protein